MSTAPTLRVPFWLRPLFIAIVAYALASVPSGHPSIGLSTEDTKIREDIRQQIRKIINVCRAMNLADWIPLILCGLAIPISLFMWLGNVAFSKLSSNPYDDESSVIPPTRWLFSTLAPLSLMIIALRRKSVNRSGAMFGVVCAFILSIANHAFFASLAAFFFSSSRATKFRCDEKRKFEENFKEGEGQRNWIQVLCNAGMAMQLATLYMIDCGSGERPIDFQKYYRSSWLCLAVLSSFASCNGDTWASELGCVLAHGEPFLITTWRRVPRGTNGAVSFVGLFVSVLGGLLVGAAYYVSAYYTIDANAYSASPPQWPVIIVGAFAGLFGSVVDSLLGATLQFSGINDNGKIVERFGRNVRHISGMALFDNHSVNLISSILSGVTIPLIAAKYWPSR